MTARVTFDFTDTAVLVTGGTSGIGHATATLFRDTGATVSITGTKADPAAYHNDLTGMQYHRLAIDDEQSVDDLAESFDRFDIPSRITSGACTSPPVRRGDPAVHIPVRSHRLGLRCVSIRPLEPVYFLWLAGT